MIHTLKCWPVYFKAILSGEKSFDIRRGEDRSYEANDYLDLQEWDPDRQAYTGAHCVKRVVYVMHGEPFAPPETWVLGLSRESRFPNPEEFSPSEEPQDCVARLRRQKRGLQLMARELFKQVPKEPYLAALQEGRYDRACGDAECRVCGLELIEHPEIIGYPTFHALCDHSIVKT